MANIKIMVIALGLGITIYSSNALAGKTPSPEFLQRLSNEINKGLPQRLDNELELRTTFVQIGAFGYMYILSNYNADEVDSKAFLTKQKQQVKNFACTNPRMKRFFDDNVDVIYSYYGKDMKHVAEIVVTSNDCKQFN